MESVTLSSQETSNGATNPSSERPESSNFRIMSLSVESAGSTLGSFTVTSGAGESVKIPDLTALGDVYDVTNEDDMSAYAATLDPTTLMDNLSNAGVPDEVITYVLSGGSNSDAEDVTDENASEAESDAESAEAGAA